MAVTGDDSVKPGSTGVGQSGGSGLSAELTVATPSPGAASAAIRQGSVVSGTTLDHFEIRRSLGIRRLRRGLPRARHAARAHRRDQGPAGGLRARRRAAGTVSPRSDGRLRPEPPQHLHRPRPRRGGRPLFHRDGAGGRRDAPRASPQGARWTPARRSDWRSRSPRRSPKRTARGSSTATSRAGTSS